MGEDQGGGEKARVRAELIRKRNAIPEEDRRRMSGVIIRRLSALREFGRARHLMCYVSVRGEVKTEQLIRECLAGGKRVSVPLCNRSSGSISPVEIADFDRDLIPGCYGIPEPSRERPRTVDIREVDLFVVPGVGFDLSGVRLGWGRGYYDSLLAGAGHQALKIGLAYEAQLLPRIERSGHDMLVDIVVTEDRLIDCRTMRKE